MASASSSSPLKVEKVPQMPTARTYCRAFNDGNNVFVAGGCDIKGIALGTFESIDIRWGRSGVYAFGPWSGDL